jgi:hypothetical protein
MNMSQHIEPAGARAISELTSLFVRLEAALAAIEARRAADTAAAAAERVRLERIEQAAAEAVRALDLLIGQE